MIRREREGGYLGRCVQIIPHITDEVKRRIRLVSEKSMADVVLVECGGTVGDIESLPFLEAFRQMRQEEKRGDTILVHVTLVPVLRRGWRAKDEANPAQRQGAARHRAPARYHSHAMRRRRATGGRKAEDRPLLQRRGASRLHQRQRRVSLRAATRPRGAGNGRRRLRVPRPR